MIAPEPTAVSQALDRLPHRRFRPAGRREAWPWGALGMVVVVAAVEAAVAGRGAALQDPVCFSWAFSARAAREKAPGCEVLCLGDSLVKHGLLPRVIEGETGHRTYNLAVAAGPAPITAVLLGRALDAGARPRAVVFDLKPGLLAGGPRYGLRGWQELLTPREALGLVRADRGKSFAAELALGMLLPSFRARHEVRSSLLAALRGQTDSLRDMNAICRRNWSVNDGANVATPQPGFNGEVSEARHQEFLSHRFNAHRANVAYARQVVALATGRGARAYLVIPPVAPAVRERRRRTGVDDRYDAFVRSLQDRNPGLTVLDARDAGYPASVFIDPVHLDMRGALALSDGVAGALRRDFAAGPGAATPKRWVRLPAFKEAAPAEFEHVELSRARLGITFR